VRPAGATGGTVARLRARPGGDRVGVTIGDMGTTRVDGVFAVRLGVRRLRRRDPGDVVELR